MKQLTLPSYEELFAGTQLRRYPRGQIIIYASDEPTQIYILKQGSVKVYDVNDAGDEKVLHIVGKDAILPAVYLFGQGARTATFYATLTDCEFYVLPLEEFRTRLLSDNALALTCMRWFAGEVREIMTRMASLQKSDTKERLLIALWYFSTLT